MLDAVPRAPKKSADGPTSLMHRERRFFAGVADPRKPKLAEKKEVD